LSCERVFKNIKNREKFRKEVSPKGNSFNFQNKVLQDRPRRFRGKDVKGLFRSDTLFQQQHQKKPFGCHKESLQDLMRLWRALRQRRFSQYRESAQDREQGHR